MTYQQPTYAEMLDILDIVMQKHSSELATELKLLGTQVNSLAHSMVSDINVLDAAQKQAIRDSLKPQSIADIATQHHTIDGIRLFISFAEGLEEKFGDGNQSGPAIVASAQLNLENYFCFVYLKDSLFKAIRDNLKKTHNNSALFRACQFLLRDEVRILRNAFSHAAWVVDSSSGGNLLKYWELNAAGEMLDENKPCTMSDERWTFLRNLAYTVSFATINNL